MANHDNQQYVREMLERELREAQNEFERLKQQEEITYNRISKGTENDAAALNQQLSIAKEQGLSEEDALRIRSQYDLIQHNETDLNIAESLKQKMINELNIANMQQEHMGSEVYNGLSERVQHNIVNYRYELYSASADITNNEALLNAYSNGCSDVEIIKIKNIYRSTESTLNSESRLAVKETLNEEIVKANNEFLLTDDQTVYTGISGKNQEILDSINAERHADYSDIGGGESLLKESFYRELEQANISEADKKTLIQDFERTEFFGDQELAQKTQEQLIGNLQQANEVNSYEHITDDSLKIVDEGMLKNGENIQQDRHEFNALVDIVQQNNIEGVNIESYKEAFLHAQNVPGNDGEMLRDSLIENLRDVVSEENLNLEITNEAPEEVIESDRKILEHDINEKKNALTVSSPKDLQKQEMTDALNKVIDSCKETGKTATFKIQDQIIKIVPTIGKGGEKGFSIFLNGQKSTVSKVADKILDKASNVTAVTKAIKLLVKVAQKIKEQMQKTKETIKGAMEQSVR